LWIIFHKINCSKKTSRAAAYNEYVVVCVHVFFKPLKM
jgi:hypothetical protein